MTVALYRFRKRRTKTNTTAPESVAYAIGTPAAPDDVVGEPAPGGVG
jgi:hypothetical protein